MNSRNRSGLRIAGFRLTMDPLLPVVILLIGWLLSERYFPGQTMGYVPAVNYILGGAASLLLTFSILFHELGHAISAVRSRLAIDRIHLFLFGGMAELRHRPVRGRDELRIALSGPLASLFLAALCYILTLIIPADYRILVILAEFIVRLNLMLAVFNLIPIYPLDGGRAMRAALWHWSKTGYHRTSVTTLNISYILILTILIAAGFDMLVIQSDYTLVLFLLAIYLAYTIFSGKRDLLYNPSADDLIFYHDPNLSTPQIIQYVRGHHPGYLERTNIPVLSANQLSHILPGRLLYKPGTLLQDGSFTHMRVAVPGDYIEILQPDSFSSEVIFSADFVPLLFNGQYHGLCDAHELRFWMQEKPHLHGKLVMRALSTAPTTNPDTSTFS